MLPNEKILEIKNEHQLAEVIRTVDPKILLHLYPDITVSADTTQPGTNCHKVTFTVTYKPGLLLTHLVKPNTGTRMVRVRVLDKISNVTTTVGELLLMLPLSGGSTTATIEWPMPSDAKFTPDFRNEITVIVDPDNEITERRETNNTTTIYGTCIG